MLLLLACLTHCVESDRLSTTIRSRDHGTVLPAMSVREHGHAEKNWRAKVVRHLKFASAKLELLAGTPATPCPDDYTPAGRWQGDRWGLATRNIVATVTPRELLEGHLLQSFDDPAEMEVALNHGIVDLTAPPTDSPPPTQAPTSYPTGAPKS